MKTILKAVMVTGLVSAGVLAGGATSHAAELDSQSTFTNHGQLAISGNQSALLGLDLNSSNQFNLSLSAQNAQVTAQNNQATTIQGNVKSDSNVQAKGNLEAESNKKALKTPNVTLNTSMTSDKKVSGSGGASLNWNNQLVSAGGYYISADRQTSRLSTEVPVLTKSESSHSVALNEKSVTSPSTKVEMNSANTQQSELKTNVKQNNEVMVTADQNTVSGTTSSQFDLLSTLTQAFNLK